MGNKNQNTLVMNWVDTDPAPFVPNTRPSGVTTGTMDNTDTIYTNIVDVTIKDNLGLEVSWTGDPSGTLSILGSSSGTNFYALTFSPPLTQPTGSADGYLIDLNQFPFKYLSVQYTNDSGSGSLTVVLTTKDLN